MKRSEHFNVVAGKWLNGYSLSVNGRKYAISGVSPDNELVLHCLDANDIVCEYSDLSLGSSHIFVNDCDHVICEAKLVSFMLWTKVTDGVLVGLRIPVFFIVATSRFRFLLTGRQVLKDKFPLIVPFHKFNPDNIGKSLRYNVVKQQ